MIDILGIVLAKTEDIRYDLQVILGRDHIDVVALHTHSVLRFHNRHTRIFAKNIRKKTLMVRGQMLDDHEGHPGVSGQESEELLQCLQAARRGADPYYTAGLRFVLILIKPCSSTHLNHSINNRNHAQEHLAEPVLVKITSISFYLFLAENDTMVVRKEIKQCCYH